MLTLLPQYISPPVVPAPVKTYLTEKGWTSHYSNLGELWKKDTASINGYMTWEQALTFEMFSRLHLGAV